MVSADTLAEDKVIVNALVDFVRNLVANEIEHNSFYTSRPPFRFLQALSPDPAEVAKLMAWAKRLWLSLEKAEANALKYADVRKWLEKLLWNTSPLCRELLGGAYETGFEGNMPPDLATELEEVAQAIAGTVACEYAHRVIGVAAESAPNGSIARVTKLHRLMASPLMVEQDRPISNPSVANVLQGAKLKVNNDMFEAKKADFSLGDKINDYVDKQKEMPLIGHEAYFRVGIMTSCVMDCAGVTSIGMNSFLSLLAREGDVIYNKNWARRSAFYVMRATEHGVYAWCVDFGILEGNRILDFDKVLDADAIERFGHHQQGRPWEMLHITGLDGWVFSDSTLLKNMLSVFCICISLYIFV